MTEASEVTVEQIKAAIPRLTAAELEQVSTAVVKDAGRRLRSKGHL